MTPSLEELDTQRDYQNIVRLQIHEGFSELIRPPAGQFLSALSCGLNLAFGVFALFVMASQAGAVFNSFITQLFKAVVYTFGFIFVIIGQMELFTEHTTLALMPVLSGYAKLRKLIQLWTIVYVGNLLGSGAFAVLGFYASLSLDLAQRQTFIEIASTFIELSPLGVSLGAVMAGWLMALLAWILSSVGDTISRIVVIFAVTFIIGFSHLPHCVAGNTELIAGMIAGADITVVEWARFQALTTLGNIVGGVVFVGLLNYSFAIRGPPDIDIDV